MSRVLFRPAAAAELDEAHRWYERERAGLGDEFLEAAQALVARLAENPLIFPVVHRDRRRAVFRRFPYSLIYRVIGDENIRAAIQEYMAVVAEQTKGADVREIEVTV